MLFLSLTLYILARRFGYFLSLHQLKNRFSDVTRDVKVMLYLTDVSEWLWTRSTGRFDVSHRAVQLWRTSHWWKRQVCYHSSSIRSPRITYSAVLLSSNLSSWRVDFRIVCAISDGKLKNKQEKLSEWRVKNFFHYYFFLLLPLVKPFIVSYLKEI